LAESDGARIDEIRERIPEVSILLLAPAARRVRNGPWTQVIRRPISIAALVQAIERLVPLPPAERHSID
jgi:hypothetical protein